MHYEQKIPVTVEFGTVRDPDDFRALYGYSPYHRVVDGVRYPPVLLLTGENDPRVDPWQSRKMAARLQAATGRESSVLLCTSAATGHGGTTDLDEAIAQKTDAMAFLLNALRVGDGTDARGPVAAGSGAEAVRAGRNAGMTMEMGLAGGPRMFSRVTLTSALLLLSTRAIAQPESQDDPRQRHRFAVSSRVLRAEATVLVGLVCLQQVARTRTWRAQPAD